MHVRVMAAVATGAVIVLIAGCGGDDESPIEPIGETTTSESDATTTLSKRDFISAADASCAEANAAIAGLEANAGDSLETVASQEQQIQKGVLENILGANQVLMDAFYTDVRPALADWRESRGLPRDPIAAYAASGYQTEIERNRVGGHQAGWGA